MRNNLFKSFCYLCAVFGVLVLLSSQAKAWVLESHIFEDNDVRVPYCTVHQKFDQGVTFFFARDLRQQERLIFGFKGEILQRGKDYPITLSFEKKGTPPLFVELQGTALQNDLLKIDFDAGVLKGEKIGNFQRLTLIGMDQTMINLNLGELWSASLEDLAVCLANIEMEKVAMLEEKDAEAEEKEEKNEELVFFGQDADSNPIKDILYLAKVPFTRISDVIRNPDSNTDVVTWQNDTVVGMVRDVPFTPSQDIRTKADNFLFEIGQLCAQGYVNDMHPVETIGTMKSIRAELACSDATQQTVSAFLFIHRSGDLLIFMNEASSEYGADAIKYRDNILKAFKKLSL